MFVQKYLSIVYNIYEMKLKLQQSFYCLPSMCKHGNFKNTTQKLIQRMIDIEPVTITNTVQ